MRKKNFGRKMIIAVPESLFKDFQEVCYENLTNMSHEIRIFMYSYVKKENKNVEKKINN